MSYEDVYRHTVPVDQLRRAIDQAYATLKRLRFEPFLRIDEPEALRADILSAFEALDNVKRGIVEPEPIEFNELFQHLPFATTILCGNTKKHIINQSVFPVRTAHHVVGNGEPLCGRTKAGLTVFNRFGVEPCPGCLAKGRALAAKAAE